MNHQFETILSTPPTCAPGPSLKPSLNMMHFGEQVSTGNRVKVKVNTHGKWALATGLSSLLTYCNKSLRLILIENRWGFLALRVQLVVLVSSFVIISIAIHFGQFRFFLFHSRCLVPSHW